MEELKEIISEYTGVEPKDIDDKMSLSGDIGLDSFSLISMICDIETSFNVNIPESEISKFQTLTDLYQYIDANCVQNIGN